MSPHDLSSLRAKLLKMSARLDLKMQGITGIKKHRQISGVFRFYISSD